MTTEHRTTLVPPGSFEPERHFYPRVLNAHIHPLVRFLFDMGNERVVARYCHLHPGVDRDALLTLMGTPTRHFRWGGADLLHATDEHGHRRMVVIETNSCPSGQKSMPLLSESAEQGGYRRLMEQSFVPMLARRGLPGGGLAVLYDKNHMEASGYAAAMADATGEDVWLVPFHPADPQAGETEPSARFDEDRVLAVRTPDGWQPIRAAFRYVTQRPWDRIPPLTRTLIFNPVVACLAGGRNKMLAAKAYDLFNAEIAGAGLAIQVPETIWDVSREEIPLWVRRMGGSAVVKVPYSNAGQGVYVLTNEAELEAMMEQEFRYDRFVVQGLIGNTGWSSRSTAGELYHVGMIPDKRNRIFVADLRCMVAVSPQGFFPMAVYGRRAREPLEGAAPADSWAVLGTNLSVKLEDGSWTSETKRLLLMDSRDFNKMGASVDDMIDAYVQSVLAVAAIDRMCHRLVTRKGRFSRRMFGSLNQDAALLEEVVQ